MKSVKTFRGPGGSGGRDRAAVGGARGSTCRSERTTTAAVATTARPTKPTTIVRDRPGCCSAAPLDAGVPGHDAVSIADRFLRDGEMSPSSVAVGSTELPPAETAPRADEGTG